MSPFRVDLIVQANAPIDYLSKSVVKHTASPPFIRVYRPKTAPSKAEKSVILPLEALKCILECVLTFVSDEKVFRYVIRIILKKKLTS